jgi:threonine synthase
MDNQLDRTTLLDINDPEHTVDWIHAIFHGLSPSGGLYLPTTIPVLPVDFYSSLGTLSFPQMAFFILSHIAPGMMDSAVLKSVVGEAFDFPAPVVEIRPKLGALELFHGPSLAFKDFGARFMAGTMGALHPRKDGEITILTATSGDTGGAVAQAFWHKPGFRVVVLYPAGKVSPIQESQFTTLGDNVSALEVAGTFDDCQALVKRAFLDTDLRQKRQISSANSINIARLLPQTCYYFWAYKQFSRYPEPLNVAVPSGNFGNIVAALLAKRMGLPLGTLIASVNANRTFVDYLNCGTFTPRASIPTVSNAMDVGNPNNFPRLLYLCNNSHEEVKKHFWAKSYSDEQTFTAMQTLYRQYGYICDPHGAVSFQAAQDFLAQPNFNECAFSTDIPTIFLHTAHPAKFESTVRQVVGDALTIPEPLKTAMSHKKVSIAMPNEYKALKEFLLLKLD